MHLHSQFTGKRHCNIDVFSLKIESSYGCTYTICYLFIYFLVVKVLRIKRDGIPLLLAALRPQLRLPLPTTNTHKNVGQSISFTSI